MPAIENWKEFSGAVEALYLESPNKTRLTMKYRHNDGSLVVKCTDDKVCLLYKTQNQQDIKKIEKLNLQLMTHMANQEA